jgi:uncharacterized protein YjbI with pentapeptide repeats
MTSVPPPEDVKPWYLRNLTQSLALNDDTGNVYVRGLSDESVFTNYKGNVAVRVDDDTVQHTSRNRRKVSTQEQIFFNTFQYTKDPAVWDEETTGTASATFDETEAGVILEVGNSAGDQVIRQTRNVIQYIPGRQGEIMVAVRFNSSVTGVRKRVGLFNEDTGFFFENSEDGDYAVVLRRKVSGVVEENRITRANWNVDKLDGTGQSGITIDFSKIQMITIEYEWFGAGMVEFKFVVDNNSYPIHRFFSANLEELPWANTPFLPERFEITNVTGVSGTHQMFQGSSSVGAEGERGPLGREENATNDLTGTTLDDANTFYPVVSIRLRPDRLNGVILPVEFQAATLDNTSIFYRVFRDATLTGASFSDLATDSFAQVDTSATAITDGDPVQTGYIGANSQGIKNLFPDETVLQLGRNNLGTEPQIFTIAIACTQSNKQAFASLSWVEIR